jgi:peptide/nickel transport system substrate-binding protein
MKRFFVLALLLGLLVLPLMGSVAAQSTEGAIVLRSIGNMSTLNPILWTDGGSFNLVSLIWPLPFRVNRDSGLPEPGLTTWTISEDGLTYTFKIRDDANWSDGTPITSKDAKFTYDAAASDVVGSNRRSNTTSFESVNIIDDKTYEVVLKNVNCSVMQDFNAIPWMPAHRFAADFSDVTTNPLNQFSDISGGPYILEEIVPDQYQKLRANPTYWGGEPAIKTVIFRVITDNSIANQSLLAGEIDWNGMQGDLFEQFQPRDNFNYETVYADAVGLFFLNWADPANPQPAYDESGNLVEQAPHPIFSDKLVRRAVQIGYDKDAILATLGEGGGGRLVGSVVPWMEWAFNKELTPPAYDPEGAKALLDEAGWVDSDGDGIRDKNGIPLKFDIAYSPVTNYFETTALVAQDQLSQLGMEITVTSLEWAAYLNDVLLAQKFDASIVSWGGQSPPDPTSTEPLLLSMGDQPGGGFNVTSYVNPELDELYRQGRALVGCSATERAKIYGEIQRIQLEDVAIDFTISPATIQVMNKRITGFDPGPWWASNYMIPEWGFGS